MRRMYVSQLDPHLKSVIKRKLITFFKEQLELNDEDLRDELERAMNSRVSDLEDTINIKEILS